MCADSGLFWAAHFIGQACNICKSLVTARSSVRCCFKQNHLNIACSSHFITRISLNIGFVDLALVNI